MEVVACLGSSSTAGRGQAFDLVGELRNRMGNAQFEFKNFGVGGDLAYNALYRVHNVAGCQPHKVIVWIGANDAMALSSKKSERLFMFTKQLPKKPSLDWYRENLNGIVRVLKITTKATIGLCSLVPIGEDLHSDEPLQKALNQHIKEISNIVAETADIENCTYIPTYETMVEQFEQAPRKALTELRLLPMYVDAFRVIVLGETVDDISRKNGWTFHSDGVHLNSRGGKIVAELFQKFIES
jgi:lysophospholipase L1-like esterase